MGQNVPIQIRKMLADRLKLDESVLTNDFRWLPLIDPVAEEEFLSEVSDRFTVVSAGFSLGSGRSPFKTAQPSTTLEVEDIATVGGLIAQIERHLARYLKSK